MPLSNLLQALLQHKGSGSAGSATLPAMSPPTTASDQPTPVPDGNPFHKMLNVPAEQGTIRNFLQRISGAGTPPDPVNGPLGGSASSPPQPQSPTNPAPMIEQKGLAPLPSNPPPQATSPQPLGEQQMSGMRPNERPLSGPGSELSTSSASTDQASVASGVGDPAAPPPTPTKDYSLPQFYPTDQLAGLREQILSATGQLDPDNPNGLSGRMNGPYSTLDEKSQAKEGIDISDALNRKSW